MNDYIVKRLGLILAMQAEIESMKIANEIRLQDNKAHAYGEIDFFNAAEELRNIVYKHEDQL